ncbi:hypothetical protein I9W82_003546 [Candida metapsilosis]|uniref:Uncharacterized protein n=1 Tax=Candida metapsilosis TaxID=273372 RepID=A0A8H7ZBK2_9ASCO|nr:hypothetical protein I9W82_003546 [Candida metapsilosis]
MISISSAIVGIIIFLLIPKVVQYLVWFFRDPNEEEPKAAKRVIPRVVGRNSSGPLLDSQQLGSEATANFYTTRRVTTPNDTFADFRARLLEARSQSEVGAGLSTQRLDGKQLKAKFKEAKDKAKQKIQLVAGRYSKKVQRSGRRNSSVSETSTINESTHAPAFDDDDPPPPYSLH